MTTDKCPDTIYVSTQADIDNGIQLCNDSIYQPNIYIRNAVGNLTFPRSPLADTIDVQDSPSLETLSFPVLSLLYSLRIRSATSLSNISLPRLGSGDLDSSIRAGGGDNPVLTDLSFNLTGVPSLRNVDFGNITSFNNLSLVDFGSFGSSFTPVVAVLNLVLDGCFNLPKLGWAQSIYIIGEGFCPYLFNKLTSVEDLTLANVEQRYFTESVLVNGSLAVQSSNYSGGSTDGPKDVAHFSTVGSHVNVSTNSNAELYFTSLTTVGGDLFVYNNTNCTLGFNQLSNVAALSMIDNIDTTIPWFPNLQRADSIYIRGHIDTSPGPNIFPILTAVPGTVTIEAWNDDFNCSKLFDQFQNGIIHNLVCNGTDNTTHAAPIVPTTVSTTGPDVNSSRLSQGAWAGIGVAIGVVVILILGGVWLFIRSERWKKELMERIILRQSHDEDSEIGVEPPNLNVLCESDGTGIIREKPDDHLYEIGEEITVSEIHNNYLVRELPVLPAELPAANS
ncbi:hypothetical protein F5Y13DRAFT_159972 [Hypoxylon sp. FL1857]|nr:hypothetical protein F5Y13DRAFT_159972 [Hypoxylon sp. FL1857]